METITKKIYSGVVKRETWNGEDYSIGNDEITVEGLLYDFKDMNVKLTIEQLPNIELSDLNG